MIVELTGIPASGKSSVIEEISKLEYKKTVIFDIENYIKRVSLMYLPFKIGYDITLLFYFFRLNVTDYRLLLESFKILIKQAGEKSEKINIYRNIYKKLVINRILQNKEEIFIIDEGVSHIPMSLFVNTNSKIKIAEVNSFLKILPRKNKVLLVDADDSELIKRVLTRGLKKHRRMSSLNKDKVILFMKKSREILELFKKKFNHKVYMNISIKPDAEKIIKLIELNNV